HRRQSGSRLTPARPRARARPATGRPGWPLLVAVVAVALNLRPAIAAVPPLLDTIQTGRGLSAAGAGLLTALPVVCMGLFAPVGPALARRVGREAAVSWALALVAAGTLVRGLGDSVAPLYGGTLIAGIGIALGGVLPPAGVKARVLARPRPGRAPAPRGGQGLVPGPPGRGHRALPRRAGRRGDAGRGGHGAAAGRPRGRLAGGPRRPGAARPR